LFVLSSGHTSKADAIVLCFYELKETFCRLVTFEEDVLEFCSGRNEQCSMGTSGRLCPLASSLLLNIRSAAWEQVASFARSRPHFC
jgi:hypothetical protein